ncbi:sodium/glutamate symporter [Atopomonas sediminilitoris]|uniref:sodium/glutamate symporter n=1 Tax=Atopomonas sediminilitoris TaxID=2919919 RepID=UPI001F4D496D|nr:sodium/glutamate symporter [Atopomonas sediminilitoris]MCJ8169323.1 sodium/glutamate symporter [Atopomonas sediminilitoris]
MPEQINLGGAMGLALAIIALWLGMAVNARVGFLERYNIPAAVTGGLLISLLVSALQGVLGLQVTFDLDLRDLLLIVFFSTIGLSSRLRALLVGGRALALMLLLAVVFLLLQNTVGVAFAWVSDAHPAYGLIGGSISLVGGHGTALSWGQLFVDELGLHDAATFGMVFATAGLISGGLLGGPVGAWLIKRYQLTSQEQSADVAHIEAQGQLTYLINVPDFMRALFLVALCFGVGAQVNDWLANYDVRLPGFLTAMFMGIVLANVLDATGVQLDSRPINLMGALSLQLFLGLSMISMPLLELRGALGVVLVIMLLQAALIVLFTVLVVFRCLGRDYDAACISAGFIGMGLGATPVGIANMNAITDKFGPSSKAFLVIPLLGAFFIDIANASVVQFLLSLPLFQAG